MTNTVALGNYFNDIEMINRCYLGIAVSDAEPEVKSIANLVLQSTHNESPVYELYERMYLKGERLI